jgi:large exoprotein involved in heme utilization and adhesion
LKLTEPGNINLAINGDNLRLKFPENVARGDVFLANQAGAYVAADGGGNIAVNARNLEIIRGSGFSAGIGQGLGTPETVAGDIILNATGEIKVSSESVILNNMRLGAKGYGGNITISGNGGNINLNISDLLLMRRGSQISTSAGTAQQGGDGGNIDINSRFIVAVPEENSDISANAFTGAGGKVQITSRGVFGIEARSQLSDRSDITASSERGVQGVTTINAPDNSGIQNSLNQLSENPIDPNALIANSCIARRNSPQNSTFFITAKVVYQNVLVKHPFLLFLLVRCKIYRKVMNLLQVVLGKLATRLWNPQVCID